MSDLDAKVEREFAYSNGSEDGLEPQRDWTPEEEKRAKRKYDIVSLKQLFVSVLIDDRLDLIIMPLLTLGFFCLRMPQISSTSLGIQALIDLLHRA